jgi:ankyrin repeat protein
MQAKEPEGERMSEFAFVTAPVVRAVCEEDAAKLRELAAGGASLDEPDGTLGVPVLAAVQHENREMLALLLELVGAAEPAELLEAAGLAVENAQTEVLRALLEAGVEPDAVVPLSTTIRNRMPLLHLAVHLEHDAVIEVLLAAGADPNRQATIAEGSIFEEADVTLLMIAAKQRKLARVKTLLAAGADPQARNKQGETALALARKAGRKSIASSRRFRSPANARVGLTKIAQPPLQLSELLSEVPFGAQSSVRVTRSMP